MNTNTTPMKIGQLNVFSLPIFELPVPALQPHHDDMVRLFQGKIKSGELKPHANGFGYQTPLNLLDPKAYPEPWFRETLGPVFRSACFKILEQAVVDWSPKLKFKWVHKMTVAWGVMQTGETWHDNPWHTHLPATLSGCYYVRVPTNQDEGNFQFMNPGPVNLFQPRLGEIRPKEGHMIIFPSFLNHRPTMSPNLSNDIRLSLCLDGHFTTELLSHS